MGFIADVITAPFKAAFKSVAFLWNNTVGKLSFTVPSWVPLIGGKGFDVPDIPMLAQRRRHRDIRRQLAVIGEAGPEAVIPLSKIEPSVWCLGGGGGMTITVNAGLVSTPDQIGQQIIEAILKAQRRSGQVFASA
jgi:hypothetical protein